MPIQLFQQIVRQSSLAEGKNLHEINKECRLIEATYIISSACFINNVLAFNDGIPTIAFFNDSDQAVTAVANNKRYKIKSAWFSSPYLENTYFTGVRSTDELLIIRFNPLLFYQAFGIKPWGLRSQPVWSLPAVLGTRGEEILSNTKASSSLNEKLQIIKDYFTVLDTKPVSNQLLREALAIVDKDRGQISVKDIVNSFKVKVNYKWLERNFNAHVGVSPKEYIKLQRFKYAVTALIDAQPGRSLFSVAVDHGYYDTGHLLKDIRQYTGKSLFTKV